jgi:hypothetical protein
VLTGREMAPPRPAYRAPDWWQPLLFSWWPVRTEFSRYLLTLGSFTVGFFWARFLYTPWGGGECDWGTALWDVLAFLTNNFFKAAL